MSFEETKQPRRTKNKTKKDQDFFAVSGWKSCKNEHRQQTSFYTGWTIFIKEQTQTRTTTKKIHFFFAGWTHSIKNKHRHGTDERDGRGEIARSRRNGTEAHPRTSKKRAQNELNKPHMEQPATLEHTNQHTTQKGLKHTDRSRTVLRNRTNQ